MYCSQLAFFLCNISKSYSLKNNNYCTLCVAIITNLCFGYRIVKTFFVTKGDAFSTEIDKQEANLSPEMIQKYV